MRRILSILSLAMFVAVGLISCNRNDGPQSETVIKITKAYLPGSVQFSRSDTEFLNKCKAWDNKKVLVNSLSDLPKDPLGFSDSYRNIDFSTSSLLICWKMHTWKIESCRNRYIRNNNENTYDWTIAIGVDDYSQDISEHPWFTRFCILVPKLPAGAEWRVWWGIEDFGGSRDDNPDSQQPRN